MVGADDDDVVIGCVSLFSGGGFGDIGVQYGAAVPVLAACELLPERAALLRRLFPRAAVVEGDIWNVKEGLVETVRERIGARRPWLMLMSPPCQGMSSNGAGRISNAIARGLRPDMDPRTRLILPAIEVVERLRPEWVVLENVRGMQHTVIMNEDGVLERILDVLRRRLPDYSFQERVLDAADFGVPQHRERLITIGKRRAATTVVEHPPFHPTPSHGPNAHRPHVTLRACTAHLPALDAIAHPTDDDDPLHCVPRWTLQQHEWMRATPEGGTAFDNLTCPMCNSTTEDRSSVQCSRCESWLPRPRKRVRGPPESYRPVRAFRTSYRRMVADRPASTLTTNSAVISSDVKGHPTQHRVLSVREVLTVASASPFPDCAEDIQRFRPALATIEAAASHKLIRHVAGESIPPLMTCAIVKRLQDLDPPK